MGSLREALELLGLSTATGVKALFPVRPPGLRELIRIAALPVPNLADLEPDTPDPFESFEVEDPQGIIHAGRDTWFLSSQWTVRRCTIEGNSPFDPTDVEYGPSRTLGALLEEAGLPVRVPPEFDHIGDLGFVDQTVLLPVRRTDETRGHLVLGCSLGLRVIGWAELALTTGESACAVNPWNGHLYVPARDDSGRLEAYDISAFAARVGQPSQWGGRLDAARMPSADIQLRTAQGDDDLGGLQGLAFSANGRVYVTRSGDEPYVNRILVYSSLTGRRFAVRVWNFPGDGDEIEGIAIHPSGVLYVCVNDNDAEFPPFAQDDFDLYTFRFRSIDAHGV